MDTNLIEAIAKSDYKGNLVKLLEQIKSQVADIRVGNYTNETRKAVIEVIDEMILKKIRTLEEEPKRDVDDYR